MRVENVWHSLKFFYGDPPSEILPGILLGNVSASRNRELLLAHSVRAVVRAVDSSVQDKNPFDGDFRYLWIDCLDTDEQNMTQFFEASNKFISEALDLGETVFVHCRQGKSRSVTLVMAFLIGCRGMTVAQALQTCQSGRVIANPNPSFMRQLDAYYQGIVGEIEHLI